MFTKVRDFSEGVAQFASPGFWRTDATRIISTIDEYYPAVEQGDFTPHKDETGLRNAVQRTSAALAETGAGLRELTAKGYCGIFIDRLGLSEFSAADRSKLLLSLGLAMGFPTPTDQKQQRLLWDVMPRTNLPRGYAATFSEQAVGADLHTDSSFYAQPEKLFFLYVVHSARCGGGESIMLNARHIKDQLLAKPDGVYLLRLLSQPIFPFQTPAAFAKGGALDPADVYVGSVFNDEPFFRFRHDMILKGFDARPDLKTPEALYALQQIQDVIEHGCEVVRHWCDDDALIIADNHVNLHGRTNFQDTKRHLVRVRISDIPARDLGRVASVSND